MQSKGLNKTDLDTEDDGNLAEPSHTYYAKHSLCDPTIMMFSQKTRQVTRVLRRVYFTKKEKNKQIEEN